MKKELTFLVIIDDSKEMLNALRYATLRASRVNGTVALLATFDSIDFSHWKAVENIAEEEFRKEAENKMKRYKTKTERERRKRNEETEDGKAKAGTKHERVK